MSDIGTSTLYSTEWMVDRLRAAKPRSIVDIGCGWGRWGFLAREFLELWEHRYGKDEWRVYIDALDIHPGTWTPVHPYVYDNVIQADVRTWEPSRAYDVAICGDVIEHMTHEDGEQVIRTLLGYCGHVLLGIPLGAGWERPGFDGNPYEAHLGRWDAYDFEHYEVLDSKLTQTEDRLAYGLYDIVGVRR